MGRFLSCLLLVLIGISCHMEVPEMTLDFSAESDKGTVTFKNNSQGAESFVWDFGDGSPVSTETAPTHKYNSSNNYKVRLIAKGNGGTKGIEKTIAVNVNVALIKGFDKVWDVSFGGSEDDKISAIVSTTDGGVILAGRSSSSPTNGNADVKLIKINGNGDLVWEKNYGGSGDDYAVCIIRTSDGGFLVGANSNSGNGAGKQAVLYGEYDYWLIKIDANGNKLWDKNYGGTSFDYMSSILALPDGTYWLGGSSGSILSPVKITPTPGGTNFWVVKVDASGNYRGDFGYGIGGSNWLTNMALTTDNNAILSGYSDRKQYDANAYAGMDFWSVKVNMSGIKSADYRFGGGSDDRSTASATEDRSVVAGYSNSFDIASADRNKVPSRGGYDFLVCRFDNSGAETWRRTYGGSGDDKLYSLIALQGTKSLLMGGESNSPESGTKGATARGAIDGWVIKTDLSGNTLLDDSFGGSGTDRINAMVEIGTGSYILAGESDSPAGTGNKTATARGKLDFWVIRIKEK